MMKPLGCGAWDGTSLPPTKGVLQGGTGPLSQNVALQDLTLWHALTYASLGSLPLYPPAPSPDATPYAGHGSTKALSSAYRNNGTISEHPIALTFRPTLGYACRR